MSIRSKFKEKLIGKGRLHRHLKARRLRKEKAKREIEKSQKKFAKEFGGNAPKSFDVKPELPTHGKKKRRFKFY